MSQMLLPTSRYSARGQRSPGAMAAAIALNGGVIALLLALPVARIVIDQGPKTTTRWIELDPIPPENKPEPKTDIKPTQKPVQTDYVRPDPVLPDVIVPVRNEGAIVTGTTETVTGEGFVNPIKPIETARVPVIQGAKLDQRYADSFKPDYPPAMRREGLEGSVTLRVTIDEKGRVIAVEQVRATNSTFFEAARNQALRYWRFLPAREDGKAIQSQQTLTLQFRLEDMD